MINELTVTTHSDGNLVVDSRLIAKQLGVEHRQWMRNIIVKYQATAEQAFGQIQ